MKLLSLSELSALVNVSARTLRQWTTDRKIPFFRVGCTLRFDEAEVLDWLEARHVRPRARTKA